MNTDRRRDIDLLVEEFWRKGYMTIYRKFGTYLPEPSSIGGFEVDVIARQKDNYAIGITLNNQDFRDPVSVKNKLSYLAQRQTRGSNRKVTLFVGISADNLKYVRAILDELDSETRKNIRLCQISEKTTVNLRSLNRPNKILFS